MMRCLGVRRSDIGTVLGWADFRDFLVWLPPTADSAWYRARKPQTWWVTPELEMLAGVLHAVQSGNWQRGGGKGQQPQPVSFPKEKKAGTVRSADDLAEKRRQLRRRSI